MTGKNVIVSAVGVSAGVATAKATITTRTNLAMPHLMAAARFSREVGAIEVANAGAPFGPFWEDMRDYATASVLMSAASAECYANELYSDREKIFSAHDATVLSKFWETFEKKSTFEKLDFALTLRGRPALDRSSSLAKSMEKLITLRNALIHFKPEWSHELNRHKKVSQSLANEFVPANVTKDTFIFPRGWVGHSCTVWAVTTVIDFIEDFERRADLVGRTERTKWGPKLTP